MQANESTAPQVFQSPPNVQCTNQSGTVFTPFLVAALLSAVLLASISAICNCILCAIFCQKGRKKDKEESDTDGEEGKLPTGEPLRIVHDSGSSVLSSASTIPGTAAVVQEKATEKESPLVMQSTRPYLLERDGEKHSSEYLQADFIW